jgi:DNA polymerase-3 subunit delta'
MTQELVKRGFDEINAKLAANKSKGDFNKAIQILDEREYNEEFEKLFIEWVRTSFSAKTNKKSINKLMEWSEKISKLGREIEKQFLEYSLEFFRQAMVLNYNAGELVTLKIKDSSFSLKKFSLFISGKNIEGIFDEIEKAIFHIERNGNPKIIFTDLSIKLTRLLHNK